MKNCYNGFMTPTGVQLCNPFAVIKALDQRHIGSYWTKSGQSFSFSGFQSSLTSVQAMMDCCEDY